MMAADLSAYGLFHRRELVLDEDALLDLENGFGADRLRRVLFDRIQSVAAWTQILIGRVTVSLIGLVVGLVFLLPLLTNDNSPLVPLGVILVLVSFIFLLRYVIVHRYHLVIRMFDGTEFRIVALGRPGRFRRFVNRLTDGIATCQEKERQRREKNGTADIILEEA